MRQKNLYLQNGYLDFSQIVDNEYPIAYVIGGRATGKTYGALAWCRQHELETHKKFLYMRRTGKKADMISTDVFNPFRPLNTDKGWRIYPGPIDKGISGFYECSFDENGKHLLGDYIGVIGALSTFSNFRGISADDIDIIIHDEFIKESTEKALKMESFTLLNVYETVSRNRELQGKPPLKMVCLSNSNAIDNDIFVQQNLVQYAEQMILTGKNQYYLPDRHIALYNLTDSPISERKTKTALYQADAGGLFTQMALQSKYLDYDPEGVKSEPLIEFKPMVRIGELCVYRHKSENRYYVTFHASGTIPVYTLSDVDKIRFLRSYDFLWSAFLGKKIRFETFYCKKLFEHLFY